jgi:hypothetical protein
VKEWIDEAAFVAQVLFADGGGVVWRKWEAQIRAGKDFEGPD